jgi:predicted RNA-binding protein (virulence factor B family)
MKELKIGQINKLEVLKETDIAYTLTNGKDEVFLHFNQTPRLLKVGEIVNAFLYYDQKKRLCATLEEPLITTEKYGFVEVVEISTGGVFVNIGINKDILLSKDYLTTSTNWWPKVGEKLPCVLKVKTNQLIARIVNKNDEIAQPHALNIGDHASGVVSKLVPGGIGIYTNDFDYVFIHRSLLRKNFRLGEVVDFKVININQYNEYNASTIQNKEYARLSDSDDILNHLKANGGVMRLGNASSPEEISQVLHMSKSAFKRAMGNLYKQQLIEIEDYKTILK